jgi:Tol biopolymer transport system component
VLCLATISCTGQRDEQPTVNIEGTVAAQVQATMQASGSETTGQIVITSPAGSGSTQAATVDIAGTGPADTTVRLHRVELPLIGEETRHQIATAQVDSGGTWQVRDVPLECGPNTFVAEDEGTGQESNMVDIVRSSEPPGPYVTSDSSAFAGTESFTSQDKVVATYYFYWYDSTGAIEAETCEELEALRKKHLYPLIDHEIDESPGVFTWKNVAWHKRHMQDMSAARIDIVLPVYWGVPCQVGDVYETTWSIEGLRKLVEAQELLLAEGSQPPKIGMFYDTGSLGVPTTYWDYYMHEEADGTRTGADLTTPIGMERFYLPIRDFFSLVPPKLWARIDDKPIVWLYNDAWAWDYNATTFRYIKEQFAKDFGGLEPYIVRENSWDAERVRDDAGWATDNAYVWGVSLYGYEKAADSIAAIGPGYDESALKDRYCQDECKPDAICTPCAGENTEGVGCPRIRGRDQGAWYESLWQQVLDEQESVHLLAIETWNEYHEGNDIAETKEFGRQYIELTAQYAAIFKGHNPPPESTMCARDRIAFMSERDGNAEIYTMNTDGTDLVRVTDNPSWDVPIKWSADGCRLFFGSDREGDFSLYVMNIDGSGEVKLTDHFGMISPDGSQVVSEVRDENGSGFEEIYVANVDGTKQTNVTNYPGTYYVGDWSPDGHQIVFAASRDETDYDMEIYVMNADGSGLSRLTFNPGQDDSPDWSPSSDQIVFLSVRQSGDTTPRWTIQKMNSDGTGMVELTDYGRKPFWSPDGKRVAFIADEALCIVDADGNDQVKLVDLYEHDFGFIDLSLDTAPWSPDGLRLVFSAHGNTTDTAANSDIFVINADGTGMTNLTNDPAFDSYAIWSP